MCGAVLFLLMSLQGLFKLPVEVIMVPVLMVMYPAAAIFTKRLHGRVPALISSGELETAAGLPLTAENSHVMLCGNPEMVKDTQNLLKTEREMRKHLRRKPGHITSEQYW